jgi:hypothetical protein
MLSMPSNQITPAPSWLRALALKSSPANGTKRYKKVQLPLKIKNLQRKTYSPPVQTRCKSSAKRCNPVQKSTTHLVLPFVRGAPTHQKPVKLFHQQKWHSNDTEWQRLALSGNQWREPLAPTNRATRSPCILPQAGASPRRGMKA